MTVKKQNKILLWLKMNILKVPGNMFGPPPLETTILLPNYKWSKFSHTGNPLRPHGCLAFPLLSQTH